ncbi:RNA-directed DNA polymerase from mobile element jockey [Anabarilius grahami]|uniref:RNA-directed DNA polymerase from mobile element jockey n=1 Tax=Anabarilius grahami TaxID=495550 RepID=A0A3N0YAB7_ANAGA|nr:RNA-directed DNA polymerase from mobile element jockey [Anabarilius grahami]
MHVQFKLSPQRTGLGCSRWRGASSAVCPLRSRAATARPSPAGHSLMQKRAEVVLAESQDVCVRDGCHGCNATGWQQWGARWYSEWVNVLFVSAHSARQPLMRRVFVAGLSTSSGLSAAKRTVATAKSAHYDQLYADLDTPEGENKIYRLANARHRSTQDIGQIKSIKDDDHQVLRDPAAILRRWSKYFSGISNQEFPHPPIESAAPVFGPVPPITPAEVELAMKKIKNCKAAGPDDIPVEVWKLLGRQGTDILAVLFNKIVDTGEVPSAWSTSVTVPIWKNKGDVTKCSNYRPIRLLCHAMKIFEQTIDARLRKIVTITPNQCGFVQGSGTTDAIHAARILLEKHREKNQTVHMAFLDLEKAFDRVPHDLIWNSLHSHGVPEA